MILKGYTPSAKPLTMSPVIQSERQELLAQLEQWPVGGSNLERVVDTWIAQNDKVPDEIDQNTGFITTRIGRDSKGELAAWERLQVTDGNCFVLNHWVTPEHRGEGYYRALMQLSCYLIFDLWKLNGAMWELPAWSEVVARETERNGYTVFWENDGKALVGFTREHYENTLRKERKYKVEEL